MLAALQPEDGGLANGQPTGVFAWRLDDAAAAGDDRLSQNLAADSAADAVLDIRDLLGDALDGAAFGVGSLPDILHAGRDVVAVLPAEGDAAGGVPAPATATMQIALAAADLGLAAAASDNQLIDGLLGRGKLVADEPVLRTATRKGPGRPLYLCGLDRFAISN